MSFTNKELKENIRKSLRFDQDKEQLSEAYVAQQKQFNLSTELLSQANKDNHIELYQKYIEDFNSCSCIGSIRRLLHARLYIIARSSRCSWNLCQIKSR